MRSATAVRVASLVMAALLVGGGVCAWSQTAARPVAAFPLFHALTRLTGAIVFVCTGCNIAEVVQEGGRTGLFYELHNSREQSTAILRLDAVEDAVRWRTLTLGHQLKVRTTRALWQELTAAEHLFREVEITGWLSTERTFDMSSVTASSEAPSYLW